MTHKLMMPFLLAVVSSSAFAQDWSAADEDKFSQFVEVLGASGCGNLRDCLTSATSNPMFVARNPADMNYAADCADLPYALRLYFAYMQGLPFDYVDSVEQAEPEKEPNSDLRYSKYGNKPKSMRSLPARGSYNLAAELAAMRDTVSTATYRMHYKYVSDFFPPSITPSVVRPGSVIYDPAGHVAMVYRVTPDGRLLLIDAHPDNSITHITFDQKFVRSRLEHGAGIHNWRPEGSVQTTESLPGFSTEEFAPSYQVDGETVSFYDWVRYRMSGGVAKINPIQELRQAMQEICVSLKDRVTAVESAVQSGIHNLEHPDRLPENIYGATGDWEQYASPSRDARLRVAFAELRKDAEKWIELYKALPNKIDYAPVASDNSAACTANDRVCFLAASLMEEHSKQSRQCAFNYHDSEGGDVRLSYSDVEGRLFKLSFDPYHCPERRWGATGYLELSSCRDDDYKSEWFEAEQGLRNQTERTYDLRMDYDVYGTARFLGVSVPPDIDIRRYLRKFF